MVNYEGHSYNYTKNLYIKSKKYFDNSYVCLPKFSKVKNEFKQRRVTSYIPEYKKKIYKIAFEIFSNKKKN